MTHPTISRRHFIGHSFKAAGAVALGAAAVNRAAAADKARPFAYEVDRILRVDPKLVHYEEVTRFACAGGEAHRLVAGPNARLYVAIGKQITVVDIGGAKTGEIQLPEPARCVAVDQDGVVYVGLRDHIEVFNDRGGKTGTWEGPGKKAWLTGLAITGNEVFAADAGNRMVLRYDKSGKLAGRIGEKNKERSIPGLIVPSPYLDVDVGKDGLVRVNNPGRHCVEAYTPDGDLEQSWGKPSARIEGFCGCCNPITIALLPDGRQVTCEKGLPRVKVYTEEGKLDCVVAGPESFPENSRAGSARDRSDGTMGGLDAAVDPQGRVYILDLVTATIRVMKPKAEHG